MNHNPKYMIPKRRVASLTARMRQKYYQKKDKIRQQPKSGRGNVPKNR